VVSGSAIQLEVRCNLRLTSSYLASIPVIASLLRKLFGFCQSPHIQEHGKDPLDKTVRVRKPDIFDITTKAQGTDYDSTHGLADGEHFPLEDVHHGDASEGNRSDAESKEGTRVTEVRVMGP
jgi:hypothetical protein